MFMEELGFDPEKLKRCSKCDQLRPLAFFRPDLRRIHTTHRAVCRACEAKKRDGEKRKNRFRVKAQSTIRHHARRFAEKWGISATEARERLVNIYGWDTDLIESQMRMHWKNGCEWCDQSFQNIEHNPDGLGGLTLDIKDPSSEPYFKSNTRFACKTCNRGKQRTHPVVFEICLREWKKENQAKCDPLHGLPLFQAANDPATLFG